ncbi:hypothetical protein IGS68_33690 (plasmid) [Skermanella sp. TT6]|uniref:Calcium-binding protein n=1 Tax=Skermanella cutis TaxID=2775420 RepID=A0ABX7BNB5_9PROT|nr:calcium-binding protein [Skermanella sp. TT6]QQP93873.1 hypothetical protein IGS68_33690 [Skermanella sp. TT6]
MATINGTALRDLLNGTSLSDTINGLGGDDTLNGLGGNDGLYGGLGNDKLFGGTGVDALFGNEGADQLYGEAGNDWLQGGAGNDFINGGSGDDQLRGDDGDDVLNGAGGQNDLRGGAGNDTLIHSNLAALTFTTGITFYDGGSGRDTLQIDYSTVFTPGPEEPYPWFELTIESDGSGTMMYRDDPVEGGGFTLGRVAGIEEFKASPATSHLNVLARTDVTVVGGNGEDQLEGRAGNQDFTGGGGADQYQFYWRPGFVPNHDVIHGFSVAEGDIIEFNSQRETDLGTVPPPLELTSEEIGGHTIYTSVEIATGQVVHTLDVDAVGLPPPAEWYYLG